MNLHLSGKCLSGIALTTLCLSMPGAHAGGLLSLLQPVAPFTGFNLNAAPNGYIIKGKIVGPAGPIPGVAAIVVDPVNQRTAYAFGAVGTFITTKDGSTNIDFGGTPNCFKNSFNYADYVKNYQQITSKPNQVAGNVLYTGITHDSFSCNQWINFDIQQTMVPLDPFFINYVPVISELRATLPTPQGAAACVPFQADFVADLTTLDLNPDHFGQYFGDPKGVNPGKLEPLCDTLPPTYQDYCGLVYGSNNACSLQEQQKPY